MGDLLCATGQVSELQCGCQHNVPYNEKTSEAFACGESSLPSGPIDDSISSSDYDWSVHLYFTSREGQDRGPWVCCALGNLPLNLPDCHRFRLFQDWCKLKRATDEKHILRYERLKCPMLNCRTLFDTPADVVDHIECCPYLKSATYWCPYCQKRENFHRPLSGSSEILTRRKEKRSALLKDTCDAVSYLGSEARQSVSSLKSLVVNGKDMLKYSKDMRLRDRLNCNRSASQLSDCKQLLGSSVNEKFQAHYATDLPHTIPPFSFDNDNDFMQMDATWIDPEMASTRSLVNPMNIGHQSNVNLTSPLSRYAASTPTLCDEQLASEDSCYYQGLEYEDRNSMYPMKIHPEFTANHDSLHDMRRSLQLSRMENILSTTLNADSSNEDISWTTGECKSQTTLAQELFDGVKRLYDLSFLQLCQDTLEDPLLPLREHLRNGDTLLATALTTLKAVFLGVPPNTILQIYALLHLAHACKLTTDARISHPLPVYLYKDIVKLGQCLIPEQRDLFIEITQPLWNDKSTDAQVHSSSMGTISSGSQSHQDHLDQNSALKTLKDSMIVQSCIHFLDIFQYSGLSSTFDSLSAQPTSVPMEVVLDPTIGSGIMEPPQTSLNYLLRTEVMEPLRCFVGLEAFHPTLSKVDELINLGKITDIRQLELNLIYFGQLTSRPPKLYQEFLHQVSTFCNEVYRKMKKAPSERYYDYLKALAKVKMIFGHPQQIIGFVFDSRPHNQVEESDCSVVTSSIFSSADTASSTSSRPTSLDSDISFNPGLAISLNASSQLGSELGEHERQVLGDEVSISRRPSSAQSESSLTSLMSLFPSSGHGNVGNGHRNFSRKPPLSINTTIATAHREGVRILQKNDVDSTCTAILPTPPTTAKSVLTGSSSEIKSPNAKIEAKCDECSNIYTGDSARVNLRRHIKHTHLHSRKRSVCNFEGCMQSFSRPDNRLAHQRKIHQLGV